ncbi:hypothetical protein SARC_10314 [Sphaeroforma arctica JP610]|uniref:Uncharacterized protein n=1 Tax=Sphaeroforma arctica JP610 TaxID=667725 RepID=A0A0L0FKD5_9EUKA|nr:hypothetical protein SARC_10314 [Sphaeroforma arctica JP610]KNC77220.1 hypothetical protein SARC_10314 [Sphaeroforma arctica JP610]|eukprot:XP_014151122.1 hypothetical protein SARC_10314 [Sphaeroforma arctica JP610]
MEGTLMISEKNGKEKEVYCFMWDGEIILTKREKIADIVSQPPVDSPKTRRRTMRQSFKVGGANRSDLVKATTAARTASSPEHYYRLASSKIDLRIDASKVYTEQGIIFDFGKGSRCIRVLIPFPGSDHIHMNAKWCTYFESAVKRSKWRQTQDASTIDVHAPSLPQASYGI